MADDDRAVMEADVLGDVAEVERLVDGEVGGPGQRAALDQATIAGEQALEADRPRPQRARRTLVDLGSGLGGGEAAEGRGREGEAGAVRSAHAHRVQQGDPSR